MCFWSSAPRLWWTAETAGGSCRRAGQSDVVGSDSSRRSYRSAVLRGRTEFVCEVEMADDAVLRDFDTTESLTTLPKGMRPEGVG